MAEKALIKRHNHYYDMSIFKFGGKIRWQSQQLRLKS